MVQKVIALFFGLVFFSSVPAQPATPLPQGHAHNDYEKRWEPLTEALKKGFVSIEIDVYPYQEQLKVAHLGLLLGNAPELETLYFKPLERWLKAYEMLFDEPSQRLIFMIDIKRNATESYRLLRLLCQKYEQLLTRYYPQQDSIVYGVVDILLSGHKPYQAVLEDSIRYMLIDGSFGDLDNEYRTAQIAPRVSARYGSLFKWKGKGKMPVKELILLRKIVAKAHENKRKIRFWGMPNKELIWTQFLEEGVDWINVDRLEKYRLFYEKYKEN